MLPRTYTALFWTLFLAGFSTRGGNHAWATFPEKAPVETARVRETEESGIEKVSAVPTDASLYNLPKALQSVLTESPFLPIVFAKTASTLLADKQCGKDALRFLQELRNNTVWAARIFDASTKVPDGIFYGNVAHYGSFDECYNGGIEGFHTRYCLIDAAYERRTLSSHRVDSRRGPDPNGDLWQYLRMGIILPVTDKSALRMALCAPLSCTPEDIQFCLKKSLEHTLVDSATQTRVSLSVSVKPNYCQSYDERPRFTHVTGISCAIIVAVLITIVVASWSYEPLLQKEKEQTFLEKCLLCFSLQGNLSKLVRRDRSDKTLDLLDGLRFFLMVYTVCGHRAMEVVTVPTVNSDAMHLEGHSWYYVLLCSGTINIEFFFCMSAILATKQWLESLEGGKSLRFVDVVIKRYKRLTPSYAFIILFYTVLLQHLGSGPLWGLKVDSEADRCSGTWWYNLLYINNYFGEAFCMFQSWYLSVDFQAHCLTFLIIRYIWKLPRSKSYGFLVSLIIGMSILGSYVAYQAQVPPALLIPFDHVTYTGDKMEDVRDTVYFNSYYGKTHLRMAGYFVGVLAGIVIYDLKRTNYRLPKWCFHISTRLGLVAFLILIQLWNTRYVWNLSSRLETSLYAGFHRAFFALGICMLIISLAFADSTDKFRRFLSKAWTHPFSKLTYGMFLSHHINYMLDIGSVRVGKSLTLLNVIWYITIDIIASILISAVLWFVVESPICELQNVFSRKRSTVVKKAD